MHVSHEVSSTSPTSVQTRAAIYTKEEMPFPLVGFVQTTMFGHNAN